ncbi:FAD-dependent oxidoreductase [Chloroflexota bacterium]
MTKLVRLLEPGRIGDMELKNRMVMSPMTKTGGDEGGYVNDANIAFYVARAKGGVALMGTQTLAISEDTPGPDVYNWLNIYDDRFIPRLRDLAQAVHAHGAKIVPQLVHHGPSHGTFGHPELVVGPSPVAIVAYGVQGPVAREASKEDIKRFIRDFRKAAGRIKEAGFDGVQLHGAGPYLLSAFQSPLTNNRTDEYGGSPEKRANFGCEIIAEIRKEVGTDFPIILRMNGCDFGVEDGLMVEEAMVQAPLFVEAGADALQVGDTLGEWPMTVSGYNTPAASVIKKVVDVPIIVSGRINVLLGERVLREGKADFIAMARGSLADPDWPNKVISGRLEDIRPCINCMNCDEPIGASEGWRCTVNAAAGKEQEFELKPAEKNKKVMVVGGGPAGLEASRVAALRGHEVLLYERGHTLGGLLPLAAMVKGSYPEDIAGLIRYLKIQNTKLGVKIRLGNDVTPALIEELKPDVVIIATGGVVTMPEIPGIASRNIVNTAGLHRKLRAYLRFLGHKVLGWLTRFWMPIGKKVVIVGGSIHGCELADFLVRRGRKVTIVETSNELGTGIAGDLRFPLLDWLAKRGTTMMTEVKYEEITEKGLTITTKEGERQIIEADTILPAISLRPNAELFKALEGKVTEVHMIGDCREAGLIMGAIADGSRVGYTI